MAGGRIVAGLSAVLVLAAAGCSGGEEPVRAVISAELDGQYDALRTAGSAGAVLKAPQGIDWDTVYVFDMDTPDETISKVVGDQVEWEEQDLTRSASELMVFVRGGEAVGAYEIAWGFAGGQYRRPFKREVRLSSTEKYAVVMTGR